MSKARDLVANLTEAQVKLEQADAVIHNFLLLAGEILTHDVANLNTKDEFFRCYTYGHGKLPEWVAKLKKAIITAEGW